MRVKGTEFVRFNLYLPSENGLRSAFSGLRNRVPLMEPSMSYALATVREHKQKMTSPNGGEKNAARRTKNRSEPFVFSFFFLYLPISIRKIITRLSRLDLTSASSRRAPIGPCARPSRRIRKLIYDRSAMIWFARVLSSSGAAERR